MTDKKSSFYILLILGIIVKKVLCNHYIPIFGNATLGYYYVEVYVGTPPQKKSLILDTGSHLTIFPCEGCTKCRKDHLYSLFDPAKSASFQWIDPAQTYFNWNCARPTSDKHCDFEQGYSEGSVYSGQFGMDSFLFENELNETEPHNHQHIFGCAMIETNEFYRQQADGIIGIGVLTKDVYRNPPTILDTELFERRVSKESFAICVAHDGGVMSLGESNTERHMPNAGEVVVDCSGMSWSDQFNVNLTSLSVI